MNVSRRYFLKSTGLLSVYAGVTPLGLLAGPATPPAAGPTVRAGRTLVVLFLRGGLDGLNLVVPHGEAAYYRHRKGIAIPRPGESNGALDLDGFFGLHPAAKSLHGLFNEGSAVALHAVGYAQNTRSHFEEQDTWETGIAGNTIHSDGWLNRHLATSQGRGPVRAIALGDALPRILQGKAPAFAVRGIAELNLPDSRAGEAAVTAALEHAYWKPAKADLRAASSLVADSGRTTLEGVRLIRAATSKPYQPAAAYPKSALARRLQEAARLIKSDLGIEVVEIDYGGWDTHNQQGGAQGSFANLVRELSDALSAFHADLGSRMDDVLVLTLSDFGRTVRENGTQGTDHGWGNCLLAMGGAIRPTSGKPRPVCGQWPGLAEEQLHERRDLRHTTDFRDVLAEAVGRHLCNQALATVLPDHTFKSVGLVGANSIS